MTRFSTFLLLIALTLSGCESEHSANEHASNADQDRPFVEYLNPEGLEEPGPFSDAIRVGNLLFLSGKIGILPGTRTLAEGGIEGESRQTMENIKTTLERWDSSLEHVVKCTVMIDDIANGVHSMRCMSSISPTISRHAAPLEPMDWPWEQPWRSNALQP